MHNVDIIDSKYKIIDEDCARYGGTSVVYKVVNDNKDILALKLFNNDRRDNDVINISFNRELELLEELNEHEHIINLLDWGFDKEIGNKYLVFNWYEKNLFDVYNLISGWDSFYEEYGKIILEALVFAYGRNIVHRDIKPENILLNDSYDIQIADFGIAKIKKFLLDPSKTLAFHGTLLYKPEEFNKINFNSSNSDDRRDVYGFTAMCLNVFANGILQNRNDLLNYLENEFDCTEEVYNVFKKSLNLEENDFYGNITDLYDDLQETYYKRKRYFEKSRVLILSPTNVISKIKNEEDDLNDESLVEEILNELNDCCLIDAYRKDNEIQKNFYIFRTTEYDYQVLIDNTGDYFVIVNRWKIFIEQIEKHRDKFYESNFEFYDITKEITKQESSKSINDFQNEFNRFLNDTKNKYFENIKKEIFYKWKNQLELQEDIKSQNNPSINYNNFEINGNEIHFHVDTAPEYKFIQEDEEWMIGEIKDIIKGPLIDVSNNSVTMMCRFFNKKNIPEKGVLRHNFMPTIKSLNRQRVALDEIYYEKSARSDIGKLITGTKKIRKPRQIELDSFYNTNLDEPKQDAILNALGTSDLLIVNGPPGTGKTSFIAELILQYKKINKNHKVLLSSQTHIAIDNALEAVNKYNINDDINLKIIRLANLYTKIPENSKRFLLNNKVKDWLKDIKNKSELFLQKYCRDNKIDLDEINISLLLKKLKILKNRNFEYETETNFHEEQISKLTEEQNLLFGANNDEHLKLELKKDEYKTSLAEIDNEIKQNNIEIKQISKTINQYNIFDDINNMSLSDIDQWHNEFGGENVSSKKIIKMLELKEEWHERFGRPSEFIQSLLDDTDLVVGTCLGFIGISGNSHKYDLLVIDEASKATPMESLVPISKSNKIIIVGDTKQLPPFHEHIIDNKINLDKYSLQKDDLNKSFLSYLNNILPAECNKTLDIQYRMSKPIGNLVSSCFYDGKLKTGRNDKLNKLDKILSKTVTWLCTSRRENKFENKVNQSFLNQCETSIIKNLIIKISDLSKEKNINYSISILSGYMAQVKNIEENCSEIVNDCHNLYFDFNSVDSYQGKETDVIIYSVTRSNKNNNIGFLSEYERLNVALSRARNCLCIVGDSNFCYTSKNNNPFSGVINFIKNNPEDCEIKYI